LKFVRNIFMNDREDRIRMGWRLFIQSLLFIVIIVGRDLLTNVLHSQPILLIFDFVITIGAGLGLAWWMARSIDHRSFGDYGFHLNGKWWMDLGFGLTLGAFLMTGIFLSMKSAGWVVITGTAVSSYGVPFILAFIVKIIFWASVALNEELTFRSYELKNLAENFAVKRLRPRGAIIAAFAATSVFFGLVHALNPNATVTSSLSIILGGFLLAIPYLLTGEIGLSIGLHFTWNLFQGTVYGYGVSGTSSATRLFSIHESGPTLWTGGIFGPEAGLLGIIWSLIGFGMILLWIKLNHKKIELYTPLAVYTPKYNKVRELPEVETPIAELGDRENYVL
jgi:uncharacterized protein